MCSSIVLASANQLRIPHIKSQYNMFWCDMSWCQMEYTV